MLRSIPNVLSEFVSSLRRTITGITALHHTFVSRTASSVSQFLVLGFKVSSISPQVVLSQPE